VPCAGARRGTHQEALVLYTAQLDAASAQRIEGALRCIGLFDPPAKTPDAIGADIGLYEITVTDGAWEDCVTVLGDGSPETARLLGLIRALIQPPAEAQV